jgi:hypothetical protein
LMRDVAGSGTEIRLPIGAVALPILAIESAADRGEYRQAAEADAAPSPLQGEIVEVLTQGGTSASTACRCGTSKCKLTRSWQLTRS